MSAIWVDKITVFLNNPVCYFVTKLVIPINNHGYKSIMPNRIGRGRYCIRWLGFVDENIRPCSPSHMCNSWLFPWFRSAPFDVVWEDNGLSLSPGQLSWARPAADGSDSPLREPPMNQGEVFSIGPSSLLPSGWPYLLQIITAIFSKKESSLRVLCTTECQPYPDQ